MSLNKRIKEIRLREDLSLAKFGKKISETKGKIYNIENKRQRIQADILQQIVAVFDINPCWLLIGEGEMYQNKTRQQSDSLVVPVLTRNELIKSHRKARIRAFVDCWFERESPDDQVWLEMQLRRSIPEYKAFISRKEMEDELQSKQVRIAISKEK